jgi:hypothetical protein
MVAMALWEGLFLAKFSEWSHQKGNSQLTRMVKNKAGRLFTLLSTAHNLYSKLAMESGLFLPRKGTGYGKVSEIYA